MSRDPLARIMAPEPSPEIDWEQTARIEKAEREAYHEMGIVLVRLENEANPLRKRLAADLGFSRFGPRMPKGRR